MSCYRVGHHIKYLDFRLAELAINLSQGGFNGDTEDGKITVTVAK